MVLPTPMPIPGLRARATHGPWGLPNASRFQVSPRAARSAACLVTGATSVYDLPAGARLDVLLGIDDSTWGKTSSPARLGGMRPTGNTAAICRFKVSHGLGWRRRQVMALTWSKSMSAFFADEGSMAPACSRS